MAGPSQAVLASLPINRPGSATSIGYNTGSIPATSAPVWNTVSQRQPNYLGPPEPKKVANKVRRYMTHGDRILKISEKLQQAPVSNESIVKFAMPLKNFIILQQRLECGVSLLREAYRVSQKKMSVKEMFDFSTLKMLPLALALKKTKNRHLFDLLVKN